MRKDDYDEYNKAYLSGEQETPNSNNYKSRQSNFAEKDQQEKLHSEPHRLTRKRQSKNKYLHIAFQIIKWGFASGVLLVFIGIGLFAYYASKAPNISQSQLQNAGSSTLYTNDGNCSSLWVMTSVPTLRARIYRNN